MAYIGKNPKFDGMILDDQASDSVTAPKSGSYKLINRNGSLFNVDSSGVESAVGTSAAGEINYISEWDAEIAVADWNLYKDTAQSTPVDGTGDGGSASITWTRQSSVVLRGTQSYKLTKTAADLEGEGASYDFDIKTQDTNKKLKIQFDYKTDEDANYASGDLTVYIYDKTNNTLITPVDTSIPRGQNIFQTSFNSTGSTSYRLIFHVADTLSTAWDAYIDHIVVGPGMTSQGAAVGGWTSYTPTTQGFGTISSVNFEYRRVGDSIDIRGYFTTGTIAGSEARIGLPSGLTIGGNTGADTILCGQWGRDAAVAAVYYMQATTGDTYLTVGRQKTDASANNATDTYLGNGVSTSTTRNTVWATGIPISEFSGQGIVPMLAEDNLSEWQIYTPTFTGFGTAASVNLEYRRIGDSLDIRGYFTTGTCTATEAQVTLPNSLTIGGNNSTGTQILGKGHRGYSTVGKDITVLGTVGDAFLNFALIADGTSSDATVAMNGNALIGDASRMVFTAWGIPITEWAGSQNSLVGYSLSDGTNAGLLPAVTNMGDALAAQLGYKQYTGQTVTGNNSWSQDRAVLIPYQTQDGTWRLKFNVKGTSSSATTVTLTFPGLTFYNGVDQSTSVYPASGSGRAKVNSNASTSLLVCESANTIWQTSGDVELDSKPTWAD